MGLLLLRKTNNLSSCLCLSSENRQGMLCAVWKQSLSQHCSVAVTCRPATLSVPKVCVGPRTDLIAPKWPKSRLEPHRCKNSAVSHRERVSCHAFERDFEETLPTTFAEFFGFSQMIGPNPTGRVQQRPMPKQGQKTPSSFEIGRKN